MSIMHIYIAPPRKRAPKGCAALPADRRELRKPGRFRFDPPLVTVPLNGIDDDGHTFTITDPPWPAARRWPSGSVIDIGPSGYRPKARRAARRQLADLAREGRAPSTTSASPTARG